MPRLAREDITCKVFHIMVQGINKEYIFENEYCKRKYQNLLKVFANEYEIKIIAYCIMSNHAHILIYSKNIENMSKYMQRINITFSKYYNNQKNRVGFVFRNRFKSEPILNRKYLYNCIAYIHNNPVKACIVKIPSQYEYSSYNDYKNGNISQDVLNLVFENTSNYLEIFNYIHQKSSHYEFIEFVEDINYDKVINELHEKNIGDIIMDERLLQQTLKQLIYVNKVPINKVSEIFKLTRYKINKIIKTTN